MRRLSIGVRLTIWYLAIFALGQFVFGAGMWLVLRHHLVSIVDDSLEDQTQDLRTFLQTQKPNADLAKFREEVMETYSQEHAGEYLMIATAAGDPVYVSPALQAESVSFAAKQTGRAGGRLVQDRVFKGKPLRFLQSSIDTHGINFIVQMGVSTREVWETLNAFRNYLLLLAPIVLILSAAGGYWLSHRALAPVEALTRTARTISGNNLGSRLEKLDTGDELQHLSDTLNEMLDRIEKTFQRITRFTADASHELRTPISLMRTEAEVALRRSRDAESYREALQHILSEAERTTGLVENLLSVARADTGRQSLTLHPLELGSLLHRTASECSPLAAAFGHELTLQPLPPDEIWILADESSLRRALVILLDNAVKYTTPPGRINIALQAQGGAATVTVSDNGIGIPADEQEKVFERFYRVDKARSREQGGFGLGLAIARWIVESHGGSIRVQSVENQGSQFLIQLQTASSSRPGPEKKLTIVA